MHRGKWKVGLIGLVAGMVLSGCVGESRRRAIELQTGESIVLAGESPANLAFAPDLAQPVEIRSTYRRGLPQTLVYEAGRDYLLDATGRIRRTHLSRIPDFGTNILYGKEDFNHNQFPGFGNGPFFVYVDYSHREKWQRPPAKPEFGPVCLPDTRKKLLAGDKVRMVAFGDSITAGGEASEPGLIFWQRWAESLRARYPSAAIEVTNGATGGDTTVQGLQRLQDKVLQQKPDLVLIGFGMNDANANMTPATYKSNIQAMVTGIKSYNPNAEIILIASTLPNPDWTSTVLSRFTMKEAIS